METEKCLLNTEDCLICSWPGISRNISKLTANHATCTQLSKQQPKEVLHPHSVPSFPWQKLECDLLDYQGAQSLLVAHYYCKYSILRKLNSMTSAAIINQLKSIFAEHVIPESFVTDNGSQYSSGEFAAYCEHWGINHITSSPLYPKSNRFIERMVQTVKNLWKKSETAGQDTCMYMYLALLLYWTTPTDSDLPSPAKLLNLAVEEEHWQDVQKQQYDRKSPPEL